MEPDWPDDPCVWFVPPLSLAAPPGEGQWSSDDRIGRAYQTANQLLHLLRVWAANRSNPHTAALLERAVRAAEAADAALGDRDTYPATRRIGQVIQQLDFVRNGHVPPYEKDAAVFIAKQAAANDPELATIPVDAWRDAIGKWCGELPPPRGNARRTPRYDWRQIVLDLLRPHRLTGADSCRAIGERRRQSRPPWP
ncbi:MAG: hypothetical protein HY744_01535 [Deltaproteobacteria bacterium]|nr:hypothetical protein [Deltaproteobacteria bacterium]